jgi:CRISPR-associated protein Cst2
MVTGLVLIDAPASALNNAGIEPGRLAENKVIVKKIHKGGEAFPYVSGQAFRRWWRDTIHGKFSWTPSPVIREEKVAYTAANPIQHEEDDVFGYMLAPKERLDDIRMVAGLTYRRVAPLKCTLLVSLFPKVLTDDFGVFSRGRETMAEPVPYEQEFYSTVLKGAFSLMLSEVGVFHRGRGMDLPRSIDAEEALKGKASDVKKKAEPQVKKFEQRVSDLIQDAQNKGATITDDHIILPLDERKRRIRETLLALPELNGGAKRTDYLTDVAPRFLIAAILSCANHIFMDVVKSVDGRITLNIESLAEVMQDYREHLLSDLFIGLRKGFLDDVEYERIAELAKRGLKVKVKNEQGQENDETVKVKFGTPKQVIAELVEAIEKMTL